MRKRREVAPPVRHPRRSFVLHKDLVRRVRLVEEGGAAFRLGTLDGCNEDITRFGYDFAII